MCQNIITFVIWEKARFLETEIVNEIGRQFNILKRYEITWSADLFGENLSAFYGDDFRQNLFQRKTRGEGPFIFIIAEDKTPEYVNVVANRGWVLVNKKAYELKQCIRQKIGSFAFHSANDIKESRHNIALMLGRSLDDWLKNTSLDGKLLKVRCDTPPARGWKDLKEFFYILNETCNYTVLRGFDFIPNDHTYSKNGDIDLLVDDIKLFLAILNPKTNLRKNIFNFFNWIDFGDNKHLLIHPKFVGDNYYDERMQLKILKDRVLNENRIYVPSDEMYFWSLLFHGVFHKENYLKYNDILKRLAKKIGIEYKPEKRFLCSLLEDYLKKNGYRIAKHLDNKAASLMRKNIRNKALLKSDKRFYCYKNSNFRFDIFDEKAIYYEPELVTEFVNSYDIFLDLDRHVLDQNTELYEYVNFRSKSGEYLWSFSNRFGQISLFTYHRSKKERYFSKEFIPSVDEVRTSFVNYKSQYFIDYRDIKLKVEDILIDAYQRDGEFGLIEELDKFIAFVFQNFTFNNSEYLLPVAWDCLAKNVAVNLECGDYYFFDTEAKYNVLLNKSFYIANVILDLNWQFFYFDEDYKKQLYLKLVTKNNLVDAWDLAVRQRKYEVNEIISNDGCFFDKVDRFIRKNRRKIGWEFALFHCINKFELTFSK